VGLRDDGTVVTFGGHTHRQRADAPTSADFVAIACGDAYSVGLRNGDVPVARSS